MLLRALLFDRSLKAGGGSSEFAGGVHEGHWHWRTQAGLRDLRERKGTQLFLKRAASPLRSPHIRSFVIVTSVWLAIVALDGIKLSADPAHLHVRKRVKIEAGKLRQVPERPSNRSQLRV